MKIFGFRLKRVQKFYRRFEKLFGRTVLVGGMILVVAVLLGGIGLRLFSYSAKSRDPSSALFGDEKKAPLSLEGLSDAVNLQIITASAYDHLLKKDQSALMRNLEDLLKNPALESRLETIDAPFWRAVFLGTLYEGRFELTDQMLQRNKNLNEPFYILYHAVSALKKGKTQESCRLFQIIARNKNNVLALLGTTLTCVPKQDRLQSWRGARRKINLEAVSRIWILDSFIEASLLQQTPKNAENVFALNIKTETNPFFLAAEASLLRKSRPALYQQASLRLNQLFQLPPQMLQPEDILPQNPDESIRLLSLYLLGLSSLSRETNIDSALLLSFLHFLDPAFGFGAYELSRQLSLSITHPYYQSLFKTATATPLEMLFTLSAGLKALEEDRRDQAYAYLTKVTAAAKDHLLARFFLADLQVRRNNIRAAIDVYTGLLEDIATDAHKFSLSYMIDPLKIRIYQGRAAAYDSLKQWGLAETDLRAGLNLKPKDPLVEADLLNHLGYGLLLQNKNRQEARGLLKKAYDLSPKSAAIQDSLAYAYYLDGEYGRALEFQKKALEFEPYVMEIRYHMGNIYWQMGARRQAYYQWKQALGFPQTEDGVAERIRTQMRAYENGETLDLSHPLLQETRKDG